MDLQKAVDLYLKGFDHFLIEFVDDLKRKKNQSHSNTSENEDNTVYVISVFEVDNYSHEIYLRDFQSVYEFIKSQSKDKNTVYYNGVELEYIKSIDDLKKLWYNGCSCNTYEQDERGCISIRYSFNIRKYEFWSNSNEQATTKST